MIKENKVMLVSMVVNAVLSLLKILSGIIGSSSSLIADGIHSFSDLSTDVFAIIGNKISRKPADNKHPYGHGMYEYLTSIGIGLVILFIGFLVIYNSIDKEIIVPSLYVSLVSIFTIVAKFILSRYIINKGIEYKQNVLIASGKESSADVISSIFVLLSSILMQFSNKITLLRYTDTVATIIVGIFIVKVGFEVLKENISTVIGEKETDEYLLSSIINIMKEEKLVKNIDSLTLIKYGYCFKIESEISMDPDLTLINCHDVVERIENKLKKFDGRNQYITIHVNPYVQKRTSK